MRNSPPTTLNFPTLPPTFDYPNFKAFFLVLDGNLSRTLQTLKYAQGSGNAKEAEHLTRQRDAQVNAIIGLLTKAWQDTNGQIAKLPEFDKKDPNYQPLAIDSVLSTQGLWFKVKLEVQKIQEMAEKTRDGILERLPQK